MDAELESFKAHISIMDVAINHFGFVHDVKDSCKTSTVLRFGREKLVVMKQSHSGHEFYFGRDENDRGSVIDFVNYRLVSNDKKLIPVRQLLRQYAPTAKKPAARKVAVQAILDMTPVVTEKDLKKIADYINSIEAYTGTYLTECRALDQRVIDLFPVCLGQYGNAIFPHYDTTGAYCGYEYKNWPRAGEEKSVTGFAEGGQKGLFIGCPDDSQDIKRIVLTEAAIDAISYYQLKPEPNTLYLSTAGTQMSAVQEEQLQDLFDVFPRAQLVLAMDNDERGKDGCWLDYDERPGDIMAKYVAGLAPFTMKIVRATPIMKDWNADLKSKRDLANAAKLAQLSTFATSKGLESPPSASTKPHRNAVLVASAIRSDLERLREVGA